MQHWILVTLISILGLITCPFWKDDLQMKNQNDFSEEDIGRLLNIEYEPNDYIEEMMTQFTSASPFFLLSMQNVKSDCAERRSFSGPDVLQFLPQIKAVIHNTKEKIEFTNDCFVRNTIEMKSNENGNVVLSIKSSEPVSFFCKDSYVIALSSRQKVKIVFSKGEHKVAFNKLSNDDLIEIAVNGIRVFGFCESISETVLSVYKTIKFFKESLSHPHEETNVPYFKKKSQEEVELDHMKFLNKFSKVEIEHRGPMGDIPLPMEDSIQSGDFIGLTQIDSLVSTMIMYLSGGRISHAAIALRLENNELYVAEMKGSGLIISTWKEFIDEQIFTHHFVVHCPLKKEHREKFDTQKAYEYFKSLGKMYGNYAILTPWFDVPDQATAAYIPEQNFLLLLSLIEKFSRDTSHVNMGAALNMRLGTYNLTMSQITIEAAKRNMTFEQLMAVPERDEWRYDTGDNIICSPLVILMYKAGGLFDGVEVNAKEFQPRDIYLLDLFDKEFDRPQICKDIDPDLPYCQVLGRYRLRLNGYASISIYPHMFEKCPSVPPLYDLSDKC